jgi:hypothetical protein
VGLASVSSHRREGNDRRAMVKPYLLGTLNPQVGNKAPDSGWKTKRGHAGREGAEQKIKQSGVFAPRIPIMGNFFTQTLGRKRREAIAATTFPPPSRTAHIPPFELHSFQLSYPSLPGGYLNGAILTVTKCQESRSSGVFRPVPFASVSPRSSRNSGVCVPSVSLWSQSNWQT